MTPQELKNSILQLAIQGKLVEQRHGEGTAKPLVDKLKKKKKEWVSSGKILRKSGTKPFYTEVELAEFDIPDSWEWVQLSDASVILEGAGIRKWQYRDSGTQILCVTNILEGAIDLEKKRLYISTDEYLEKYQHLTPRIGDIVTACSGGSWGKTALFDCQTTMMLNTSTLKLRFLDDLSDNRFLYYLTKSLFFKRQLERQLSGMQPNFGYAHYSRIMIPLPPLAEQKRIVAKIEELLPLVERYERAWRRLEDCNRRFPGDMQKAILQLAIQGKLVEQRPGEGTGAELYQQIQREKQKLVKAGKIKKEKPLPEIAEDEKPFEIPEGWAWVRLGNIGSWSSGATPDRTQTKYYGGNIPWLKTGDLNDGYVSDIPETITDLALAKTSVRLNPVGSVLMAMYGATIGKLGILEIAATTNQACCACIPYTGMTNKYLFYFLMASRSTFIKMGEGGAQPNISKEKIVKSLFPLPPLAEQKRIVAKIEELLPLCARLQALTGA